MRIPRPARLPAKRELDPLALPNGTQALEDSRRPGAPELGLVELTLVGAGVCGRCAVEVEWRPGEGECVGGVGGFV